MTQKKQRFLQDIFDDLESLEGIRFDSGSVIGLYRKFFESNQDLVEYLEDSSLPDNDLALKKALKGHYGFYSSHTYFAPLVELSNLLGTRKTTSEEPLNEQRDKTTSVIRIMGDLLFAVGLHTTSEIGKFLPNKNLLNDFLRTELGEENYTELCTLTKEAQGRIDSIETERNIIRSEQMLPSSFHARA